MSDSTGKAAGMLMGITLTVLISLHKIDVFIILNLPVCDHGIFPSFVFLFSLNIFWFSACKSDTSFARLTHRYLKT